jgi:hypothetical protein
MIKNFEPGRVFYFIRNQHPINQLYQLLVGQITILLNIQLKMIPKTKTSFRVQRSRLVFHEPLEYDLNK